MSKYDFHFIQCKFSEFVDEEICGKVWRDGKPSRRAARAVSNNLVDPVLESTSLVDDAISNDVLFKTDFHIDMDFYTS